MEVLLGVYKLHKRVLHGLPFSTLLLFCSEGPCQDDHVPKVSMYLHSRYLGLKVPIQGPL